MRSPRPHTEAVRLRLEPPRRYSRLALLKPVLLLPHLAALIYIYVVGYWVWVGAVVSISRHRRYPPWAFEYLAGVGRWTTRVWAYGLHLTDTYPPFSLWEQEADSLRLDVVYPPDGRAPRWQPWLAWILALPALVLLVVAAAIAALASVVAGLAILFTARYPRALLIFMLGTLRYATRLSAFVYAVTPEYPLPVPRE